MTSSSRSIHLILAALLATTVTCVAADPAANDADSDGVPDNVDLCPYSAIGSQVDAQGCALDEDFDGVANGQDQCPNSPYGEPVDSRGCEIIVPGSQKKLAASQDEPVPVTKVAPSGPASVTLKNNPDYVDENELFAPAPPRADARRAEPVVVPASPAAPAVSVAPAPAQVPAKIPVVPAAPAAPAVATSVPQPAEPVIIQVAPSRAAEPDLPAAPAPVAASAPAAVKTPAAVSVPVAAVPAAVERPVVQAVVVPPEVARETAEQRATMSPAGVDRTPSLPKAATVDLPVQSLPADSFPPGYAPNRTSPQVNVPLGTVPGPASGNARKLPVTPVPATPAVAPKAPPVPAAAVAVTPRAPVPVTPPPVVPVPVGTVSAATAAQTARSGVPVVGLPPVGDSFPQTPIPSAAAQGNPGDTLAEIGFAAGSAELSAEATQRVRQLAGTISSRLSGDPSLALRLAGRRHAGEPAAVDVGRGLALRKAFLAEGIDDARIRIVIIDGPAPANGDYQVKVQLIAVP